MNMEDKQEFTPSSQQCEQSFYSILGCDQDATFDELKHNYQILVKKHHPDKQTQEGIDFISDDKFVMIDKAFKTLKDEKARKEYDASLLHGSFDNSSLIYAEIEKKDLNFVMGVFYFTCRCGDNIEITEDIIEEGECIVECSECTNCILIK
ncbi:unnamed protein product [Phaedon cochleariae]|uniref:Uncharacterized protein n=1 Tax=Phaedon cochleariae TaxID=80249 RepID=A0A9P0DK54_PHACE|nr:unnamed protein product [Phaedon cochleariae]